MKAISPAKMADTYNHFKAIINISLSEKNSYNSLKPNGTIVTYVEAQVLKISPRVIGTSGLSETSALMVAFESERADQDETGSLERSCCCRT